MVTPLLSKLENVAILDVGADAASAHTHTHTHTDRVESTAWFHALLP